LRERRHGTAVSQRAQGRNILLAETLRLRHTQLARQSGVVAQFGVRVERQVVGEEIEFMLNSSRCGGGACR
jgi:hypothetical protein